MNIKQKVKMKIQQISINIFSNQILLELNRLFVLVYSNEDVDSKRFKAKSCYLP